MIMVSVAIILFLGLLIRVNIQKKEDSNISVCMRIMTNYFQMISACLAFNLKFPTYFTDMINGAKSASGSSDVVISLDCFLKDTKVNTIFDNVAFLKIIIISMIPLVLIACVSILFCLMFASKKDKFKRYMSVSVITIFFLLHPTLTQYCLRIFKCVDIGEGEQRVGIDINIVCWSADHLKWVLALGVPMAIIYSIGLPLIALIILVKNKDRLADPNVLQYIILLYQGLNHRMYFWELVNTFRKCTLLLLQAFIPRTFIATKILIGSGMIFCLSVIQARLRPFKIGIISDLEHREMVASIITLFSGLIFIQTDGQEGFNIIVFCIVIVVNARFYLLWFIVAITIYKKYKVLNLISIWMRRTFCIEMSIEDENKLSYNSKATTEDEEDKNQSKSKKYKKKKSKRDGELNCDNNKSSPKISKVERLTSMLLMKNEGKASYNNNKKRQTKHKITSKEILDINSNEDSIKELFDNTKSSRRKIEFSEFKFKKNLQNSKKVKNKKKNNFKKPNDEEEKAIVFWFDNMDDNSDMNSTPHQMLSNIQRPKIIPDENSKAESKVIALQKRIKHLKKNAAIKVFDDLVESNSEEVKK